MTPDRTRFGAELKRPNPTEPSCYDCTELYHGCTGRPPDPNRKTKCRDRLPLPTVGLNGQTGQAFPESRMNGRKEPRLVTYEKEPTAKESPQPNLPTTQRQTSPAAQYNPSGDRICACGAPLKKRHRCCDKCRTIRRTRTRQKANATKKPAKPTHPSPGKPQEAYPQ